jgi:adenylate cyclase
MSKMCKYLSEEENVGQKREFARNFRIHFWVMIIFMSAFIVIRNITLRSYQVDPVEYSNLTPELLPIFNISILLVSSFIISLSLTLIDIYLIKKFFYRVSLLLVVTYSAIIYLITLGLIISGVYTAIYSIISGIIESPIRRIPKGEIFLSFFVVGVVVTFSRLIVELDKRLGPGNMWKIIRGKFYTPTEEVRIFMFVDLKGATAIAERLGHVQVSKLLRDCFHDLSIVDRYHAEVYQYVGDEVVLTWLYNEDNIHRFIPAFFAFQDRINSKRDYYLKNYGLIPEFKAGAHVGPVISTEVGDIKREITYHGDTLNTASRIQGKCNEIGARLLISRQLYNTFNGDSFFSFADVGSISLEGKEKNVELFKVINPEPEYQNVSEDNIVELA